MRRRGGEGGGGSEGDVETRRIGGKKYKHGEGAYMLIMFGREMGREEGELLCHITVGDAKGKL